jgi:hypothetical protein
MKNVKVLSGLIILLLAAGSGWAGPKSPGDGLPAGPFTPGFRLLETSDETRSFPSADGAGGGARPMRIYVWYPAKPTAAARMRLDDYVRMALEDFRPHALPVPLAKGLDPGALAGLRARPVQAALDAEAAPGRFPVLVFGQGLFFESPLSNFILCEYLASHGYVVATCPLLGTLYRLVNIDVEDVETEVRDMEFAGAEAGRLPFAEPGRLGIIGFDLGGMAGLIMTMRDIRVGAFLSLDSGILDRHRSGLPAAHPQYREERFRVPWMHLTQARSIRSEEDRAGKPSLFERKAYGASYLVHVPTTNHGDFSSYAALGIAFEGPGYWNAPLGAGAKPLYEGICLAALAFFDAHLKGDRGGLEEMLRAGPDSGRPGFRIEHKPGQAAPPTEAVLIDNIINRGVAAARPEIERLAAAHPGTTLIGESVLGWLAAYFQYWWGREDEALGVLELNVALHPGSSSAHDSLGEAYAGRGRTDEAIRSFRKSLELDPENANAKAALERLTPPVKKRPTS